jgi:branched-chain amino acid transport system substrate-binding protein
MGRKHTRLVGLLAAPLIFLAACGGGGGSEEPETTAGGDGTTEASGEPITVGIVTTSSGLLGGYGQQYLDGLEAGLDYATDGTGQVNGRPVELEIVDDGGEPQQAISAATGLIGEGVKIIAGSVSSGVAVQMAPFAAENDVLFISGPAASDAITGINENTFRSGRQTYQDVATAASLLEDVSGDVLVLAQDSEFGAGNVAAVEAVLGGGATVDSLLVPLTANEFTPFAQQIIDAAPDLLFVAWAGDTTSAMWQSLQQQGVFDATTVTTGLGDQASFSAYGENPEGIEFLSHYFPDAPDNEVNQALLDGVEQADLFTPDGFVAAQMIVRALSEGDPEDTASMISALEGWEFDAPKGTQTIRASDHAMLQPMFTASLTGETGSRTAELLDTLEPEAVAPPEAQ